jgi:hypothetical protein
MAATFNVFDATPYSCTIAIAGGNGAVGTFPYVATMVDDIRRHLVSGPLMAKLDQLFAVSALNTLNVAGANSGVIRTRMVDDTAMPQTTPALYTIQWTGTELSAQITASALMLIEIRLQHSEDR